MSIHVLAPDVIDKIAAGEVLERPANLLKELIENAIDAGATQLDIEFDQGGREVVLQDNGCGMSPAELPLALQRHATSKIVESEDLYRLNSFGFRGEALASIAAVSRLSLTSRRQGATEGFRLDSEFGKAGEPVAVAAREGTEVRVRELFANVPARLRFLKSETSEHTQIKTTLKALALAHENVAFRVRSKGALVFHWAIAKDFKTRARDVLQAAELYAGELTVDGITAEVLASAPQETQNVNRNLWFFVQGRWVQDRSLSAAVMEGYRNLLMHGQYPTAIVRLRLAPEEVDVNVHPTKAQVKFRDSQAAFRVACRAIRQVLEKAPWLGTAAALSGPAAGAPDTARTAWTAESFAKPEPHTLSFKAPEFEKTQYSEKVFPLAQVREAVQSYTASAATAPATATSTPTTTGFKWADLHVIGQLNHTYIVAQTADDMYLVDQHAAHERVMFERLFTSYKSGTMDVQNLLLPLVLDLSAEEVEALHDHREAIERLGLSVERMGPESLAVQAIPSLISESAVSEALHKLAYELTQNSASQAFDAAVGEIFASLACHSVIRAGQSQSAEQMKSLLTQMDLYPLSSFCPHGRPVYIKRRFSDIEREFGRIV